MVFGVKYSKIKHTRCIFVNIFVQDCILFEEYGPQETFIVVKRRCFLWKWNKEKDFENPKLIVQFCLVRCQGSECCGGE